MELELDRTQRSGYEAVLDTTVCREETLESIVPDACPDILRICDTEGVVCLRDKVLQDGRVELSGSVRAALLYLPDGEEGIRRMEVELPFSCTLEHPALTPLCRVVALPRVQGADARLINPRKVLVRVDLAFCVQVYAPVEDDICSGVLAPEEAGVQQMSEQCDACTTVCVQEKPFTFSDEISLSGSKPEAEELLKCRAALRCSESKVIGNKLIFKGESQLQMLYRSSAGGLCTAEYELPFSQIMEITGAGEESTCDVYVVLTGLDCALDSGDGRTISVSMGLLAQAVVREERTLQMLTDVYSTAFQLTAESRTYTLGRRRVTLTAEANVTVLYLTEDGARTSITRQLQAACPLELPEEASCSCHCGCTAPVFATPTTGGIEVRFPVGFRYTAMTSRTTAAVSAVHMDEGTPRDHSGQPSIVLRMVGNGERLWDIAKSYGTTAQDIMCANALEEDVAPEGQLLLIPRKR